MPKLFFVVTCNAPSVALLASSMLPEVEIRVVDLLEPSTYRPESLEVSRRFMEDADFILAQKGGYGPLALEALHQTFPHKVKNIATFWFRGLHPDGCYVGSWGDKFQDPSFYHSAALVAAYREGRSERWARHHALSYDQFERLGLWKAWEEGIHILTEEDATLDFPASALVDVYCHEKQGFLTFNHPCLALLHEYYGRVFKSLGFAPRHANLAALSDPMRAYDRMPVFDFVAEYYSLPYRESQLWYLAHLNKYIDAETYIHLCYETYRRADPAKLTVSVPPDLVLAWRAHPSLCGFTPAPKT